MTNSELKQYLSKYRNDDEAFSEALSELLNRNPNGQRYSADMPPEEIERVIREHIEKKNSWEHECHRLAYLLYSATVPAQEQGFYSVVLDW